MWAYGICHVVGGVPEINNLPFHSYAHIAQAGEWALYLFSGTGSELSAIGALSNVIPLVAMTDDGTVRYSELNNIVSAAHRTKLNTWLTARGYPTIPAGWTYRQILMAILQRLRGRSDDWDINESWVSDN